MKKISIQIFFSLLLFILVACERNSDEDVPLPNSHAAQAEIMIMADGWTPNLPYEVPKPGTFALPIIGAAGGGVVLDIDGKAVDLENLFNDKIVTAYIYI